MRTRNRPLAPPSRPSTRVAPLPLCFNISNEMKSAHRISRPFSAAKAGFQGDCACADDGVCMLHNVVSCVCVQPRTSTHRTHVHGMFQYQQREEPEPNICQELARTLHCFNTMATPRIKWSTMHGCCQTNRDTLFMISLIHTSWPSSRSPPRPPHPGTNKIVWQLAQLGQRPLAAKASSKAPTKCADDLPVNHPRWATGGVSRQALSRCGP